MRFSRVRAGLSPYALFFRVGAGLDPPALFFGVGGGTWPARLNEFQSFRVIFDYTGAKPIASIRRIQRHEMLLFLMNGK
jgi:hypothetical protein